MARGIKFKVFEGTSKGTTGVPKKQFFAHMISGNGTIVWQTEGYDDVRSAHKACKHTWENVGKALSVDVSAGDGHPVPYTQDSLLPRTR